LLGRHGELAAVRERSHAGVEELAAVPGELELTVGGVEPCSVAGERE
jgi:hypothetical protein